VEKIDLAEVLALYHQGQRNAQGFSDDPRYLHILEWLSTVHSVTPHAWPYLMVRGNQPDTRREGQEIPDDEFIYLVDVPSSRNKTARFLEAEKGCPWHLQAWNQGETVERPGIYEDRFGRWMSDYAPLKDKDGRVQALLGVDLDADYADQVEIQLRKQMLLVFLSIYALLAAVILYAYRLRFLRGMFGRYVSLSLLRDRALMELGYASKRRVTVLFTDINDFSTICERHNALEVISMLDDYFAAMNEIITASGGWIKQFVGDEIMVIYGAPDTHPNPERAALETALKMVAKLQEMKAAAEGEDGFFEIKAGINTGEVIVGNVGSRHRTEFAAVGDDVNLGSRIMGLCKQVGATILLSEATYSQVRDLPGVEFTDHGEIPVRGRVGQVRVYGAKN
jgi:class 3 adenylate cyclase